MKPGDIVLITWRDATALQDGYWEAFKTAKRHTAAKAHTVGFLVRRTKRQITVMQSFHKQGAGGVFTIPTDWVTRIKVLTRGER